MSEEQNHEDAAQLAGDRKERADESNVLGVGSEESRTEEPRAEGGAEDARVADAAHAEAAHSEAASAEDARGDEHPRKWVPNRPARKVKTKKTFDRRKVDELVQREERIYRGELDENRRDPSRYGGGDGARRRGSSRRRGSRRGRGRVRRGDARSTRPSTWPQRPRSRAS